LNGGAVRQAAREPIAPLRPSPFALDRAGGARFAVWLWLCPRSYGPSARPPGSPARPVRRWILNGYASGGAAFRIPADLTPWAGTFNHVPLGGNTTGVARVHGDRRGRAPRSRSGGFRAPRPRSDDGAATPNAPRGAARPGQSAGPGVHERLPWPWLGHRPGSFGLAMRARAARGRHFAIRGPGETFANIFPPSTSPRRGLLQLMISLAFIVVGFAASTLVSGWARTRPRQARDAPRDATGSKRWAIAAGSASTRRSQS